MDMPEIAEVETVRNTLKKRILNKKIKDVAVYYERMIEGDAESFKHNLVGQSFRDIKRRGKWLIFETEDYYLLSHLRMEGKYFLKDKREVKDKHEHVIFTFSDDEDLRYCDTRKFGRMKLILKDELEQTECIKKQGIEPLDNNLTSTYLMSKFKNKHIPIKTALLDQTIISGLGNIYANEVLFAARIHPQTWASTLKEEDCKNICVAANNIIKEAIKMGGTTIKSYTSSLGVTGKFQQNLKVHKRENEKCLVCQAVIQNIKIGGRSTYFCPNCQKEKQ